MDGERKDQLKDTAVVAAALLSLACAAAWLALTFKLLVFG